MAKAELTWPDNTASTACTGASEACVKQMCQARQALGQAGQVHVSECFRGWGGAKHLRHSALPEHPTAKD